MSRIEILENILESKIVAILRAEDSQKIIPSAKAIVEGGVNTVEVSLNTPNALECIHEISTIPGIIPGVGTVTAAAQVHEAVKAGAQFIVSPITKLEIIEACHALDKPVFSGALTPTEVHQASDWGADVIKIFPAELFGMKYIKALKTPFPELKLMPTGGINAGNIDQWFDHGADCVGIGTCFTMNSIMANEDWDLQTARAKDLVKNIKHFFEVK